MPSPDYVEKRQLVTATKAQQAEEALALFQAGLNRAEIARRMKINTSTVSDRLEAAGIPRCTAGQRWTEYEVAILQKGIDDPSRTAASFQAELPHRTVSVISMKLRSLRISAGVKVKKHGEPSPMTRQATEREGRIADWQLPPGAYRDRRGITLALTSVQEASHV